MSQNIAPQVLPGKWQVVGESVIFTFDEQGNPVSVHNDADPTDFKTNIVFGEPQKLDTPIGMVDALFVPTVPEIDSQTGQARFGATSAISHIVLGGLPMPGAGHANYQFTGQYDAATGQLVGQSDIKVTYGFLVLYSDTLDNYILQKIE